MAVKSVPPQPRSISTDLPNITLTVSEILGTLA